MQPRRIAILYICTGKYRIFWDSFYNSSREHLLTDSIKHFFVFTDATDIEGKDVTVIFRNHRGFPEDSLLRFEMFLMLEKELHEFDFVFFFNSNMVFRQEIGDEILPPAGLTQLVGVLHPGYYNVSPIWFPYERNKGSEAHIPRMRMKMHYMAGAIIGGSAEEFINLSRTCLQNIRKDLEKGIVAVFHDESHINRFFSRYHIHILDPGYAYPEGWSLPFTEKIMVADKVRIGGAFFLKQPSRTLFKRSFEYMKRFIKGVLWYITSGEQRNTIVRR